MKKYILPFMSIAILMAMTSCSSSDDAMAENNVKGKLIQMTFTATQESNVDTRSALSTGNSVIWKKDDAISVFDDYGLGHNHEFTLEGDGGSTSGNFTGTAESTPSTAGNSYFAVYPSTSGAELNKYDERNDHYVSDITLPSKQTAIKDSFDPKAALMIAASSDQNHLNFINVVSLVKVTTDFACKRIVLNANENIAGKGNIYYNNGEPYIEFTSDQSTSIVLKPATEGGDIAAGTYYIAVKPGTLTAGWSISFTSTDYNVYTRVANNGVTFNRGNLRSIGSFNAESTPWTSTSRGDNVTADQEVDLGLTIEQDGKKFRVIFAKSNLTSSGLAASETDFGDYFAWGAIEPWLTSYDYDGQTISNLRWKEGKNEGYIAKNAPFYDSTNSTEGNIIYTQYFNANDVLQQDDDAARHILKGGWQIPTEEIWLALNDQLSNKQWISTGTTGYKLEKNGSTDIVRG